MTDLATPDFIQRDPATIEAEAIATYETALGKMLFPGQLERLMLNANTYRELLVRIAVQEAALQNLVNYATGVNLDQLGELLATPRLAAQAAQVTVQFTREGSTVNPLIIPDGTRVGAGNVRFALDEDLTIAAGQAAASGLCTATVAGAAGNGFTAGQVNTLVDLISGVTLSVTNTDTSSSGADVETDDRYRARIKLAPEKFSVAGSAGAYEFYALTADSTIIDVAIVTNPPALTVNVYPLVTTGIPAASVLTAVDNALQDDTVRPLTDIVNVQPPTEVNYDITAAITAYPDADQSALQTALETAAQAFAEAKAASLGNDIVRSQLIAALSLPGVYDVNLTAPASDVVIAASEWANVGTITITIPGTNEG
jgi:phage-related baseplate assembly protein